MGNEYGLHKNRNYSYEVGLSVRVKNNLRSLYFHHVHGDNVQLSKGGTVAYRAEGFCKGIVFSGRPVAIRELVYVKFLEIATNWSGALRIGFTMNDPVTVKSKLPRYACPDLTTMHGNWAKAIAERLAKKDSILFYYVDSDGDVHYGIDSEEYGVFFGGVNTSGKLWAVLDIYGNTVAVEFVDPSLMNQDNRNELLNSANAIENDSIYESSFIPPNPLEQVNLTPLCFHHTHGCHTILSRNGIIATRQAGFHNFGYAFTERPIKLEEKIILRINQTDMFYQGTLIFGFTSCDPSNLIPFQLPENVDDLVDRPEYWVFSSNSEIFHNGDIAIFNIDTVGQVQVKRNNAKEFVAFHVDPTQPLWFFVVLHGSTTEIHLIGTTNVTFSCLSSNFADMLSPTKASISQSDAELDITNAGTSGQAAMVPISECVICCEKPVNCALYRCGHMCMCYECASKYWTPEHKSLCPICRKPIADVIKTYR